MVNTFLETHNVQPVSASSANIVVIGKSDGPPKRQIQRATVTIIHTSPEVVINGEEDERPKSNLQEELQSGLETAAKAITEQFKSWNKGQPNKAATVPFGSG